MIYALQRIWEKEQSELEALDIRIVAEQNLIVTPDKAIKLHPGATTIQIQRTLRPLIRQLEEKRRATIERNQNKLF